MADITATDAPVSSAPAKKKKGWVVLIAVLAVLAAAAVAVYFFALPKTVTFDPGNGGEITTVKVKRGQTVDEPAAPEMAGQDFAGWLTEDGSFYDFSQPVKGNLKLTASFDPYAMVYYVVDIEVYAAEKVLVGNTAPNIENVQVPEEFVFGGWEADGELYDFSKPVTEELILSARLDPKWIVTFISDGDIFTTLYVKNGDLAEAPAGPTFSDPNITFVKWVSEEGGDVDFDFSRPINADLTVYAKLDKQIPIKSITFDQAEYYVEVGKTIHPIITIDPEDTSINLQYLSKDMSIAYLSAANGGTIKGVSEGDVRVFIIPGDDPYGDKACEALVHVVSGTVPVESISFADSSAYAFSAAGKSVLPKIVISPENATDQSYTLTSSNENVCFINNGMICAKGPGSCVITVTSSNGKTATRTFTVDGYGLSLTINDGSYTYYTADHSTGIKFNLVGTKWTNGTGVTAGTNNADSKLVIESGPDNLLATEYTGSYFRLYAKNDVDSLTTVKAHFEYNGSKSESFTIKVEPVLALADEPCKSPYYKNVESTNPLSGSFDVNVALKDRNGDDAGATYITFNQAIDHYDITAGSGNIADAKYLKERAIKIVGRKQSIVTVYRFYFTDKNLSMYKGYPLVVTFYTKGGQTLTVQFANNHNK